jgi:cell wall-associated NlpC family hydrolase
MRKVLVPVAVGLAAMLAASAGSAKPPPRPAIAAKQKRAQEVLAQVNALDIRFGKIVDSWNGARIDLAANRRALAANRIELRRAQRRARTTSARLAQRLVAIYENGGEPTLLEVIVGASDFGSLLDRLHAAETVASYDRKLAEQVTRSVGRLFHARRQLRRKEQERRAVLAQLDGQRRQIGAMLEQRRRLLASVQTQVAAMEKREAARQKALAAAARARLARAQAEARAAAAKAAAKQAAAAAARAARPQTTPAPTAPAPTTTAADPPPTVTTETTTATTTTAATTTVVSPTTAPVTTAPVTTSSPPLGTGHPEAASIALQYLGIPYRWGGDSPAIGFDCSGLVMYVYAQLRIQLPHQAAAQYRYGSPVPRDQLEPGDLVFFDDLSHVGIYIGDGEMVHAPQTGDVVSITPLSQYGSARYVGARRLP